MGKTFGEYLRETRQVKGISQQRLAELVDYDRSNISAMEAGKRTPSKDLVKRLAVALMVTYESVLAVKIVDSLTTEREEEALFSLLVTRKRSPCRNSDGQIDSCS